VARKKRVKVFTSGGWGEWEDWDKWDEHGHRVIPIPESGSAPSKRPKQPKQQYRKRVQEEIIRRVRTAYPNGVGDTSTAEVRRAISDRNFNPSWDSVHRALDRK
jgi:hypothetical protein